MASDPNSPEVLITEILGNVFISCIMISNYQFFFKMEKSREVGKFNIYPFILVCGQAIIWVGYGAICNIIGVIPVNVFVVISGLAFVLIYVSVCDDIIKKRKVIITFVLFISFAISIILIFLFKLNKDNQNRAFGWLTAILLTLFFSSPLFNFYFMYKEKTTKSLSVPLSITSILAGLSFGLYGYFLSNYYIVVPNFFGAFSGLFQILFYYFMRLFIIKKNQTDTITNNENENENKKEKENQFEIETNK